MTAGVARRTGVASWDAAGFDKPRVRSRAAPQIQAGFGHVRPDVGVVAVFWTTIIGLDFINDWLIAGLVQSFRPIHSVATDLAVWWSGWLLVTPLVLLLGRRFAERRLDIRGILIRAAAAGLLIVPAHLLFTSFLFRWIAGGSTLALFGHYSALYALPEAMTWTGLVAACIIPALGSRRRLDAVAGRALEIRARHADRLEADARLAVLRRELDAHLLLNVLATASGAVVEGEGGRAVATLSRIGDLVRAGLVESAREVPLEHELSLLERYVAVERARSADGIDLRITLATDARRVMVPTFILQPLVENALRHGAGGDGGRIVHLDGEVREGVLDVHIRNAARADAQAMREGTGLSNTRRRLAHLYGNAASLSLNRRNGSVIARLRVPLVRS
jgi:two-component system, LytTR family, sensor kinase